MCIQCGEKEGFRKVKVFGTDKELYVCKICIYAYTKAQLVDKDLKKSTV